MKSRWLILFALVISVLNVISAQDAIDPEAPPLFATVDLDAGEELDPFLISVVATGTVDTSMLADGCVGYVAPEPDVALYWGGESDLLRIFFYSTHDATLTIITPNGDMLCNDDASGTLFDPLVDIENPTEGRYAIFVGHVAQGQAYPGLLVITSDDTYGPSVFNLEGLIPRDPISDTGIMTQLPIEILQTDLSPLNEANVFNLEPGFDQQAFDFEESGQIALFNVQTNNSDCTGFVESLPTAVFHWTGEAEAIEVLAEGDHDSSLLVYTPSGDYICNDDTLPGGDNLNPSLVFETPEEGRYVIYVGSYEPGEATNGTVTITENIEMVPITLTADEIAGEE